MTNGCTKTVLEDIPAEKSTFWIQAVLVDRTGQPIPGASVSSVQLSLYVRDTAAQETINNLSNTEILNTSRLNVDPASGLLEIRLDPTDMIIVNPLLGVEWHEALLKITLADEQVIYHRVDVAVENLSKVA